MKVGNVCASLRGTHEPAVKSKDNGQVFICKHCGCFYVTEINPTVKPVNLLEKLFYQWIKS